MARAVKPEEPRAVSAFLSFNGKILSRNTEGELENVKAGADSASGLSGALIRYLTHVIDAANQGLQPPYLGNHKPSELYVEPEVVHWEPKEELTGSERPMRGPLTRFETESLEIGEEDVCAERYRKDEKRGAWEQEREQPIRCAVILGPPGQGKTTLLRITARQLAQKAVAELMRHAPGIPPVEIPVMLTFKALAAGIQSGENAEGALRRIISDAVADVGGEQVPSAALQQYVIACLQEKRVCLLLDALDELEDDQRGLVAQFLDVLAGWRCGVVMTSRPHGYGEWQLPFRKDEMREYRLAPLSAGQSDELVGKWYGHDNAGRERLLELLRQSHSIRQLARVPFLLTLLCWAAKGQSIDPRIRRTGLYRLMMVELLGAPESPAAPAGKVRGEYLLDTLGPVVLELFEKHGVRRAFSYGSLKNQLPGNAEELIAELRRKHVLAPAGEDHSNLVFPHRSIGEYLAGHGLARLLKTDQEAWQLVHRRAWHPDWEQVVLFLAGTLAEPEDPRRTPPSAAVLERLLDQLGDAQEDDCFRHRLGLAGSCLAEIPHGRLDQFAGIGGRITQEAWSVWWKHHCNNTAGVVPHLHRAMPALALSNFEMPALPDKARFLDHIAALFQDPSLRWHAPQAVGRLGSAIATPESSLNSPPCFMIQTNI